MLERGTRTFVKEISKWPWGASNDKQRYRYDDMAMIRATVKAKDHHGPDHLDAWRVRRHDNHWVLCMATEIIHYNKIDIKGWYANIGLSGFGDRPITISTLQRGSFQQTYYHIAD
jgi:hypothetical protein